MKYLCRFCTMKGLSQISHQNIPRKSSEFYFLMNLQYLGIALGLEIFAPKLIPEIPNVKLWQNTQFWLFWNLIFCLSYIWMFFDHCLLKGNFFSDTTFSKKWIWTFLPTSLNFFKNIFVGAYVLLEQWSEEMNWKIFYPSTF